MNKNTPLIAIVLPSAPARTLRTICAGLLVLGAISLSACSDDRSVETNDQGPAVPAADPVWIGTWAASPQRMPGLLSSPDEMAIQFNDQTLRMVARVSRGGDSARVRLDNSFGSMPVTIGAAAIALHDDGSGVVDDTTVALTFAGEPSVTLPVGESVQSDTIAIDIPDLEEVAISVYLPQQTLGDRGHSLGRQTTYISEPGNFVSADDDFPQSTTTTARYFLSGIEVQASNDTQGIVTLGDSITDGFASTVDANARWPDQLAERLFDDMERRDLTIINAGISGNRILNEGVGPSAVARLDRDLLDQSGAAFVVLLEGINDIGFGQIGFQTVSADDIIQGYRDIISRAHDDCLKIIGATVTPFGGAGYFTDDGEVKRQALNTFIRDSGEFDAVIDFDAAVRDPDQPIQLLPAYDSGDNLHPNDDGYEAMAQSVDTAVFDEPLDCAMDTAA